MRAINILDLDTLATRLDTDGLTAHEDELRAVAARARRDGISPALVGVIASPGESDVARLRAFGRIAAQLAAVRTEHALAPAC